MNLFWYCIIGVAVFAILITVYALCCVAAGADAHIEMMQKEREDEDE